MNKGRRDFLKKVGGAGVVLSSTQLLAKSEKLRSIPTASNVGAFYADVDESGKIVKIRPQISDKDPKVPGARRG